MQVEMAGAGVMRRRGGGGRRKNGEGARRQGEGAGAGLLYSAEDSQEHATVVDFFKRIWRHQELPPGQEGPPTPSEAAVQNTSEENEEWLSSLRSAPRLHRRRFFLVEYGIDMMEKEREQRVLHVSLVAYTAFVILFSLYVSSTIAIESTFSMKEGIYDAVIYDSFLSPEDLVKFNTSKRSQQVLSLATLQSMDEVWDWLRYSMPYAQHGLFTASKRVADTNTLLGAVRLRQVRLSTDTCLKSPDVSMFSDIVCYGMPSVSGINTSSFGPGTPRAAYLSGAPGLLPERVNGKYSYSTGVELCKITALDGSTIDLEPPSGGIIGELGTYDTGGFVVDLPTGNSTNVRMIVEQLYEDAWLSRDTGALFISFTTYNPNVNLFAYHRANLEFAAAGNVVISTTYRPFVMPGDSFRKDDRSPSPWVLFTIFALNVTFWFVALFVRCLRDHRSLGGWDALDAANLLLLVVQMVQRIVWHARFAIIYRFADYAAGTTYFNFEEMSWHFEFERALASVNAITVFVKFFKLTRLVMRLSLIVHVVSKAARHLLSWFVVAGMVFVGYVFFGWLYFGPILQQFSTFGRTARTLFQYLVASYNEGDGTEAADTEALMEGTSYSSLVFAGQNSSFFLANPDLFFISFTLIFYLFLMRVMVAMIVTAYSEVSRELERREILQQELKHAREEARILLPVTWRTSMLGKFFADYFQSGIIPFLPEPPSEKHVLSRLKGEPALLNKGYLSYPELEELVRDALSTNPTKWLCWTCGKRKSPDEVNDALVENICVSLLATQRINLHRVPQMAAVFHDLRSRKLGKGSSVHGQDSGVTQDDLEAKDSGEWVDPNAASEWNVDCLAGNSLHACLYVFRNHLVQEHQKFHDMIYQQDSAIRSLITQVRIRSCIADCRALLFHHFVH